MKVIHEPNDNFECDACIQAAHDSEESVPVLRSIHQLWITVSDHEEDADLGLCDKHAHELYNKLQRSLQKAALVTGTFAHVSGNHRGRIYPAELWNKTLEDNSKRPKEE